MAKTPDKSTPFHDDGLAHHQHFEEWWMEARKSEEPPTPYDFLVNFGVQSELVQDFFLDVLADCCGSKKSPFGHLYKSNYSNEEEDGEDIAPGAIDYFVRQLFLTERVLDPSFPHWKANSFVQEDFSSRYKFLLNALRCGVEEGPTHQDIATLVEMESIREENNEKCMWGEAVQECVRRNFNSQYLQCVFDAYEAYGNCNRLDIFGDRLDLRINKRGFRPAVDRDCVGCIRKLLFQAERLYVSASTWREGAFAEFLEMVSQTTTLTHAQLSVPKCLLNDDNQPAPKAQQAFLPNQEISLPSCGLQAFYLDFDLEENEPEESDSDDAETHDAETDDGKISLGEMAALELLPRLPHLETLYLSLRTFSVKAAAPYVAQLLKHAKLLENLTVRADTIPDPIHMLEVVDAMRHSPSLQVFEYSEGERRNLSEANMEAYESKLLEILQKENTQLTRITLEGRHLMSRFSGSSRKKIDYYLDLNRDGRTLARGHNTNLMTFVELLYPKEHDYIAYSNARVATKVLNRFYGLLREAPGIWSHCERLVDAKSRKRKACHGEEILSI